MVKSELFYTVQSARRPSARCLSARCPVGKVSGRQGVQSARCPVGKMSDIRRCGVCRQDVRRQDVRTRIIRFLQDIGKRYVKRHGQKCTFRIEHLGWCPILYIITLEYKRNRNKTAFCVQMTPFDLCTKNTL